MKTLHRQGLRVPRDVSVVGFGDLKTSQLWEPALTTVAQPFQEMGRCAVKQLIAQLQLPRRSGAAINYELPTRLLVRESTAPAS
jgi:LacI family transcriptional regulator